MIPYEIEGISNFKNNFPRFMKHLTRKYPFDLKLRKFKNWALDTIDKLYFTEHTYPKSDQIFDASIFLYADKYILVCPLSINISKLITKIKSYPRSTIKTSELYKLVHPDIKNKTLMHISHHQTPPILLQGDCFNYQLIDGNHRTVVNYKLNQSTTEVIIVNKDDLYNCLEYKDFEVIIDIFSKLNNILKKHKKN